MTDHDVKDLALAPGGKLKIDWAEQFYVVPRDIDLEIARLKLHAMDVQIDKLTPEQETYLSSWQHGT
jgi:S-adenosylhomocysteine hydrolase